MEKNRKRTQKGESNVYPRNVEVIRSAWSTIEVKIKNETVIEKTSEWNRNTTKKTRHLNKRFRCDLRF